MIKLFHFLANHHKLQIYKLSEKDCRKNYREYPTYCVVDEAELPTTNITVDDVLNDYSCNEFDTLQECLDFISETY